MPRVRRALVASLLVVTAAACSSPTGASEAEAARLADTLRAAATRTAGTPVAVSISSSGPARGRPVRSAGTGVVDPAHRTATLDLRVDTVGPVQARVLGPTAYAALPAGAIGDIAHGRPWIAVEMPAVDRGLFADMLVQLGTGITGNPADTLGLLAAVHDVRDAGPDTVAGRPTTRYTGTVDVAGAATSSPALAPVLRRYSSDLSVTQLPVDVWTDAAGRVRRVTERLAPAATSTIELGDPAATPTVAAPPSSRVTNLPEGPGP